MSLPELPGGRTVPLPGRGTLFVRDAAGPSGADTVVLIHGLGTTADVNWQTTYRTLSTRYRVLAPDLRGHGRGISAVLPYRLEDCADDVAALADALGVRRLIVVGYSMGGLVAQLLWRRHPRVVGALVLCATARNFRGTLVERATSLALPGLEAMTRAVPSLWRSGADLLWDTHLGQIHDQQLRRRARQELTRTGLPTVLSAARAATGFTSHDWIGRVDVPTAVVVTTRDQVVAPRRQRRLAEAIPGATIHPVDADHLAFAQPAGAFVSAVSEACRSVQVRMTSTRPTSSRTRWVSLEPDGASPPARGVRRQQ